MRCLLNECFDIHAGFDQRKHQLEIAVRRGVHDGGGAIGAVGVHVRSLRAQQAQALTRSPDSAAPSSATAAASLTDAPTSRTAQLRLQTGAGHELDSNPGDFGPIVLRSRNRWAPAAKRAEQYTNGPAGAGSRSKPG